MKQCTLKLAAALAHLENIFSEIFLVTFGCRGLEAIRGEGIVPVPVPQPQLTVTAEFCGFKMGELDLFCRERLFKSVTHCLAKEALIEPLVSGCGWSNMERWGQRCWSDDGTKRLSKWSYSDGLSPQRLAADKVQINANAIMFAWSLAGKQSTGSSAEFVA